MNEKTLIPNEQLSAARQRLGYALAQVASALNLPVAVIVAFEEGSYDLLHGDAFVCGVIRAYAGFLNIDAEPLVASYKQSRVQFKLAEHSGDPVIPVQVPWSHIKYRTSYGVVAVLVLVIIARMISVNNDAIIQSPLDSSITIDTAVGTTIVTSLDEMPAVNPTQDVLPEVSAITTLSIGGIDSSQEGDKKLVINSHDKNLSSLSFSFSADCWVEIQDGNNQKIFASMQRAQEHLVLTGKPPFRITLGYAPGVALSYNSQPVSINFDNTHVAKLVLGNS